MNRTNRVIGVHDVEVDPKLKEAVDHLDRGELVTVLAEVEAGRLSQDQFKTAVARHRVKQSSFFVRLFGLDG